MLYQVSLGLALVAINHRAIQVALPTTYALRANGLTSAQIESPESWSAAPEQFINAFSFTAHFINGFALLAILFSAMRGGNKN